MRKINVVLLAFVDSEGLVLLNKRADAKHEMWEFIGGGIEEGESALDLVLLPMTRVILEKDILSSRQ